VIHIRPSQERGHFNHGWLESYHSFSFADYFDPGHMGFRNLRVINEDFIQPAEGFGTHGHRDMEIITYVLSGALEHKDSMGTGSVIKAGDIQYMSAGKGVTHSEFNHSQSETTHLLQIWILPSTKNEKPRYGQQHLDPAQKRDQLKLLASGTGESGSIEIRQDIRLFASILSSSTTVTHQFQPKRFGWLQLIRGKISLQNVVLSPGDGAAISNETEITMTGADQESEFLLFDLN
jgi:redox-sensitive bicupin YhaK (pirin superfamily)